MGKRRAFGRRGLSLIIAAVMTVLMVLASIAGNVYAAAGDVPAHKKSIEPNGDGTYKLALNVTGQAEKVPQYVNVTVILDVSGSMNTPTVYTATTQNGNNLYGLVNGQYVELTRNNNAYWYNDGSWHQYTGTRYIGSNPRLAAAKSAVNSVASALLSKNGQDGNPSDMVEMALVTFSNDATVARTPVTTLSSFQTAVDGATAEGGTNWEDALSTANGVQYSDTHQDKTFVIFVSDGNPTFRNTEGTYPNHTNDYNQSYHDTYGVWGSGSENDTTVTRCYDHAKDDAQTIATRIGVSNFFTIGAYGDVSRMQSLTTDAGAPSGNYYSASNTTELENALNAILAQIEMAGFADVEIDDGTTNNVKVGTTSVELLEVDETSYQYYRAGGDYGTGNGGLGTEWKSTDDPAPPAAQLVDGEVQWDLSSLGVLENGVTYTVTFDVYPSQYTYDTIAKLKNGDITYDSLDENIQKYIVDNGGGSYSLRTNTNASLDWDDTRDAAGKQSSDYINPDPVATDSEQLTITKKWEGGDPDVDSLPLTVLMDNQAFHDATLSKNNGWTTSTYISVGLIKNGQALPGALGHDFSFAELDDTQYHWELDAPTVRPMLINGVKTMLIKVDDKHPAPSGATTYTIEGSTYYVDTAVEGLTATNHRRSNLNLTKAVTGEDAPKDATFPFTLTVNNSKAPATEPTDDPEHNSDYWVWFSIYDTKAGATVMDATVSGATGPSSSGYYYAPSGTAISVQMKDGWNLRFTNLPSGTTYTFAEGALADGFAFNKAELTEGEDSTFNAGQTSTGTIEKTKTAYAVKYTNDYQLTNLEITKEWVDNNDQDGKRLTADELKEKLTLSPAVEGKEPTVVDNGDGTYKITYTGLPRFNNGQEVEYTVAESAIDGYTTTGSPAKDHGTITNTHEPEETEIHVKKEWIGPEAQEVTVTLLADGQQASQEGITAEQKLTASNNWEYAWTGLDKYKAGKEIVYTVTEAAITGYSTSGPTGAGTAAAPFVFTNTNDEETEIFVKKVWVGPEKTATIHLLADGEDTGKTVTLPSSGANEGSFDKLRKYDATDGHEIAYTVTEDAIANYTTTGPEGSGTESAPYTFTNTNDERLEIPVEKIWDDADNQDGKRPTSVTVHLKADGVDVVQGDISGVQTLDESNEWKYTWTGLYKYNQTTGTEIAYTLTEDAVTDYQTEITGSAATGFTVKNSYTPGKTTVTVTKVWKDAENQDGIRPENVEVTLLADGEAVSQTGITAKQTLDADNQWTYTWQDLNQKKAGKDIVYTVKETETAVITGTDGPGTYKYEITGDATEGFTVTNTHTPETVEVPVEKVWNDANDQDGFRPESVEVGLKADGETVSQEGIEASMTLDESNEWKYTWTGLNKYKDGEEIAYTVVETTTSVITGTDGPGTYSYEITGDATKGFTVTNTHTPELVVVPVTKVWNDADDQDGFRPESVEVTLLADGAAVTQEGITAKQTLDESNSWKYTWEGLYKYSEGEEIAYTVEETKTDVITGTDGAGTYAYAVTGDIANGFTVTNTHTPELVEVPVTKVWSDADDQDGFRPASVEVTLLADGEAVSQTGITAKQTLDESNSWKYTWEKLYKYSEGEEIAYTVEETKTDVITGTDGAGTYAIAVSGSIADGFTVTNTHTPELVEVPVTKVWSDANDQDGIRPESVEVTLLADGAAVTQEGITAKQTLSEENTWKYTWEGLYKYSEGKEIAYTVEETKTDVITGTDGAGTYAYEITGNTTSGYIVTNTHTPELVEVPVEKVWDDADDQDGIRPATVQVKLLANGEDATTASPATLQETNEWMHTWYNQPKYSEGKEIDYTVEEIKTDVITGTDGVGTYAIAVSGSVADGFTVTNTHTPELTEVFVKKIWVGPEAEEVTFNLYADGEKTDKSITLNADGNWEGSIAELDKYKDGGKKIAYTVSEDEIPAGYTMTGPTGSGTENDPYAITNTNDERIKVPVEKVWDDADDQDGKRPTSVTVHLKADGNDVEQDGVTAVQTLDEGNEWKYTWENLYKYNQSSGAEITYSVTEDAVPEYGTNITGSAAEGFVITNSYTPGKTSVTVTKAWSDTDDQDGIRPESVEVTLLADGEVVSQTGITAKQTLDESNTWTYTWNNLDLMKSGKEIAYTVEETKTDVITGTDGPGTYAISVSGEQKTGYTVTNTHTPETVEVPVEKVWDDADDQDGIRPDSVEVTVLADGTAVQQDGITAAQTLSESNSWKYTWTGLNKYKAGVEIQYTVEETKTNVITGTDATGTYAIAVSGDAVKGYVVTNTHTPDETEVEVTKVWDDQDDLDGIRPDSVDVTLLADGKAVTQEGITAKQTLSESNEWTYKWTGLNKKAAGKDIEYTVEENPVPDGYMVAVTGSMEDGFTVTNTHTPPVKDVFDAGDTTTSIDGKVVQPGQEIVYKITYTNSTEDDVTATITDEIPAYTTFVSADNGGTESGGTITWTADVAKGESITVSFTVKVDEETDGAVLENEAKVNDGKNEYTTNEVTNPTTTPPTKDVYKAGDTTTSIDGELVQPGEELTYAITYKNTTGEDVKATITDKIPAHTTFVSADNGGTESGGTVTWTLDVAKDAEITVTFNVKVDEDVDGAELKNDAKVKVGENEYTTNEVTNPTPSEPVKDVFKSGDTTTSIDGKVVQPGDQLTYAITYKNTTGADVKATITDEIPAHTSFVSADNGGTESGGTVTWTLDVAKDASVTVTFDVKVDDDVNGEVLVNDANVNDGHNDYKTNEVKNPTPTDPEKDVFKEGDTTTSIDGEEVQPGDTLTYAITYTNTTGEDVKATITDKIPAHTTFVSADNGGTESGGTVTWTLDVAKGDSITVTFNVKVDDDVNGATLYNEAKVNDGKNDYTTNETKNPTPSEPVKDVFDSSDLTTSIDGKTVQVGTELVYTITYTNTTGKDATATITDKIPQYTSFVSADKGGTESGGIVTWTQDVAKDASVTVSFKVKVDDEANDVTIPNTADVRVGENTYTTNEVTNKTPKDEPSEPTGEGNLEVKKVLKGRKLKAGEFSFTLTPAPGAPGETETVKNDADGKVKFSEITFRKIGEYQYKITEEKGSLGGVTYAENSFTAIAKVTADETDDTKLVVTWMIDGQADKIAVFENTYDASGKIDLEVKKELTGTNLTAGMFSFELKEGDKVLQTKTNDADGKVKFDTISYDLDDVGNKTYTIHEVDDKKDGYTYDTEDATVTVTIKDNEDGTLSAKAEYSKTTFKNTYEASGDIQLIADKTLTGRTLKDGEFSFTLTEVDEEGNVVEGGTTLTAKNEASGAVTFDKISYTMDDMVEEETEETTEAAADTAAEETTEATTEAATEAAADQAADKAAETKETVYTKVTTKGEATTKVSYTYTDEDGKEQTTDKLPEDAVDNGDGTYTVTKTVTETVTEEVADETSETGTTTVEKEVEKEVKTVYTKVEEEIPGEETVTYTYTDENGEEQTVTELPEGAKDNGDGTYTVTETVEKAAEEAAAEGEEPAAEAGAEAEEAAEEELKSYVTEKVFYYQITEDSGSLGGVTYDTHKETVKVTVTDNGDGTLTAVAEYDDDGAAFVNPYNAKGSAEFDGIKKLENHELAEGQFSFKLTDKDNKEIQTVTNGADGSFSFDEIKYTEKDAGKTFTYYITELNDNKRGYIYDSHTVEVTVEVKDNEDGTLNCKVTCSDGDKATFTNTYKPLGTSYDLKAKKRMEGRSLKADEFEFILRDADGNELETVTNTASGSVSFSTIAADEAGTFTYTVEEVEGTLKNVTYDTNVYTYTVTVEDVDGQLTVTIECDDEDGGEEALFVNVYEKETPPPPPTPPTPPTGDENSPVLWAVLFAAAAAAAGAVLYLRRRGRREDEEEANA